MESYMPFSSYLEELVSLKNIQPILVWQPNQIRDLYIKTLHLIATAKVHEKEGKKEIAVESYLRAGSTLEELQYKVEYSIDNRKENLTRELEALKEKSVALPNMQDITKAWSAIHSGYKGEMKEIYASKKEAWKKEKRKAEYEKGEKERYAIRQKISQGEAIAVIDALKEINWLQLDYEQVFQLQPQHRENIHNVLSKERGRLAGLLTKELAQGLSLPSEAILSHNIYTAIELYTPNNCPSPDDSSLDIREQEEILVKLNLKEKKGSDIITFGFAKMRGYDPQIKEINPLDLVSLMPLTSDKLSKQYQLEVYNPTRGLFLSKSPCPEGRERAEYIKSKLTEIVEVT